MILSNFFVVAWTLVAAVTLPFCLYVAYDASRDVQAREAVGINHGREAVARLLLVTSSLTAIVFGIWLCLGLYVLFLRASTPEPWKTVVTPAGLVLTELVLAGAMIYKQQVRRRVLLADMRSETARAQAAALASTDMQDNTAAQHDVADAVRAMTHDLSEGPLAASLASTVAIDKNTIAMDANTASRREDSNG